MRGGDRAGPVVGHPYSLAVALAYAGVTRQLRGTGPSCAARSTSCACSASGTGSPTTASGGWCSTAGRAAARRASRWPGEGIDNLARGGALARMPYWLALLADLLDRGGDRDGARARPRRAARRRTPARRRLVAPRGAADARRVRRRRRGRVAAARGRPAWPPSTAASPCCGVRARSRRSRRRTFCRRSRAPARPERRAERRPNAARTPRFLACGDVPLIPGPPDRRSMTTTRSPPSTSCAAALRGELVTPDDPRLRRGARRLQRHDRQAPGRDRPLPRRRRRHGLRPVRPRARGRRSPCAAAATTPPGSASGTTPWSSTSRCMRSTTVDPERRHRARRRRLHAGRTSTTPPAPFGLAVPSRVHRHHRRRAG